MADQNEIIAKKCTKSNSNRMSNILTWETWAEKYALPPGSGDFNNDLNLSYSAMFTLIGAYHKY